MRTNDEILVTGPDGERELGWIRRMFVRCYVDWFTLLWVISTGRFCEHSRGIVGYIQSEKFLYLLSKSYFLKSFHAPWIWLITQLRFGGGGEGKAVRWDKDSISLNRAFSVAVLHTVQWYDSNTILKLKSHDVARRTRVTAVSEPRLSELLKQ